MKPNRWTPETLRPLIQRGGIFERSALFFSFDATGVLPEPEGKEGYCHRVFSDELVRVWPEEWLDLFRRFERDPSWKYVDIWTPPNTPAGTVRIGLLGYVGTTIADDVLQVVCDVVGDIERRGLPVIVMDTVPDIG
jgi:hypothetical protein